MRKKEKTKEGIATRDIGLLSLFLSFSAGRTTKSSPLLPYPYFRLINAIDSKTIFLFRVDTMRLENEGIPKIRRIFPRVFSMPL